MAHGLTGRLAGMTRSFKGTPAVSDLDLELQPGRIYGLLGPNGAGKTTTLRVLLGLIEADRGTVELFGRPPDDAARAKVGYVPEQRALPEKAKVEGTLAFFARMRGYGRREARELAGHWLDRLALGEKAGEKIANLSNGQQQKVQLALALLLEPDLLLLDEPLAALDPQYQEIVIREIREAAARGATVVLSTHRLREAQELLDHVVMLYRGTKVLDAPLVSALEEAFDGTWRVRTGDDGAWVEGPELTVVRRGEQAIAVRLEEGATIAPLLGRAAAAGAAVHEIQRVLPTLHELYLERARALDPEASLEEAAK